MPEPTVAQLRAEVERLSGLLAHTTDRAVQAVQRAQRAEDALDRVRAVLAERRMEVAESEADNEPSAWSDAVAVTCARVEDALRDRQEAVGVPMPGGDGGVA